MARKHSFDVDALIRDIQSDPIQTNTFWGNKYGVSRERVRQVREEYGLNSVTVEKENYVKENFDQILELAKEGKFIANPIVQKVANCSPKFFTRFLATNEKYADLYGQAIKSWEMSVYFPTHKTCKNCDEYKSIDSYYKTKSDGTRDGYARVCKTCVKQVVKRYYDARKNTEKVIPEEKLCSAVPEVGPLPSSEFRRMKTSNSGLQPQCSTYQDFYIKFRKENDVVKSREMARKATIEYYDVVSVL